MVKGRFTINPFPELKLSPSDTGNLHEIASSILEANVQRYETFQTKDHNKVDLNHWKVLKTKEQTTVYTARHHDAHHSSTHSTHGSNSSDLPSLLSIGTTVGALEDMMFGVINPTLESMRIKASYVDDLSGAAVLANLEEPTLEDPFRSLVVKWMELDIPLHTTSLVKNRDYVYVEATGMVSLPSGERVGYHVLHSVNFPQTHNLPGRVRADMSICGLFRQVRPNAIEVFVTGVMDPGGDMIRMLVVPSIAAVFLSTLKYAHCGQMKKLAWMLEKRYTEAKELGTPNREHICVTCSAPITNRKIGDFGKSSSTCKLCFGYVCHSCKIERKLSFVTPDLLLAQRKVTFCAVCLNDAIRENAIGAARAQIIATGGGFVKAHQNHSAASDASRFTVNPFQELALTPSDTADLQNLANSILDANVLRYEEFLFKDHCKIDSTDWKLVKSRDNTKVHCERNHGASRVGPQVPQTPGRSTDLPSLLAYGTAVGDMEDMMFGVVNPTLESMRIKASYVDDLSGAAVLSTIVEPTLEDPFKSLVVKWMELDIPLHTTSLVKNRDYIYVEGTGVVQLSNGERVGYHILHSVNFPETHDLPGRVRANLSICGIFRQVRSNASEIYVTGLIDPGGDIIRMLVVPNMATTFLSTLKYAHCGQMKKLAWMLEKRYTEAKELGTPNRELVCVTCACAITSRKLGDFGKSNSTCKLCFGHVCHNCKIQKKLSFVTPDLLLAQRKVTFCAVCVLEAMKTPASTAARAQILAANGGSKSIPYPSNASTASSVSDHSSH
ncbi:hypothetical protein BBJ29_006006 [Phytophthora kernoviae]|uniref:FYVE-type domain-containing protein n=1 Tax=Phytophthora kernoviae TaxID=325452 RepID=A0A3F2RH06_9STRA|nr:hypothetical protein BBP00_00007840 [Phytophthora kernoviae]RLN70227.1 hypothetical protein BBJ29_006006 [Phytophthora kernoviae]